MPSTLRCSCFEIRTLRGKSCSPFLGLQSTPSKSPDVGCCGESRGFSSARAQVRSIRRSWGKLVGKRRCRNIGVRYSVYSVNVRFWRNLENSVVLYGQDVRNGRSCSLFANDVQIPKLDVAGWIPVSRFIFQSITGRLRPNSP